MVRKVTGKPRGRPSKDESERVRKFAISLSPEAYDAMERVMEHAGESERSASIARLYLREAKRLKLK